MTPAVPGVIRYASRTLRTYSRLSSISSALRIAQRRPLDLHRVTLMPQSAQQRFHHRLVAEEVMPFVVLKIRRDNRGTPPVSLLHQLEKDVGLLRLQI